ncbi:MAG: hypothetical protein E7Z69_07105 [Thermoplasmata archaeon]|nr:hypothetical protein [Thermoplasmata archaeon]
MVSKVNVLNIVITLVLLAIADALILVFVSDWNTLRYVTVGMINAAFLLHIMAGLLVPQTGHNDYIYTSSTGIFTTVYVVIELLIGISILVFDIPLGDSILIVIQVVLFVLITLFIVVYNITNHNVEREQAPKAVSINLVKKIRAEVKDAYDRCNDPETKKVIDKAMDDVNAIAGFASKYGDLDNELMNLAQQLVSAVLSENNSEIEAICAAIHDKCAERKKI